MDWGLKINRGINDSSETETKIKKKKPYMILIELT